jgi:AraC-like DNA-binding protein
VSRNDWNVSFNLYPGQGELVVLFAGHEQTPPLHNVGPQILDYHLVHFVTGGRGTFECRGRTYMLEKGDHFFIFPGELVRYASDGDNPWSYRWIGFKGTQADAMLAGIGISASRPTVNTGGSRKIPACYRRIERTLGEGLPAADWQAGGYMRVLLGEIAKILGMPEKRSPAAGPGTLLAEQAVRWLTLQYHKPISIEQMARDLGYHRTYLAKQFKAHTGVSPVQFLLRLRLEKARQLLQEPLTIEQVAASVGFADPLYFSKQFRARYGYSPSEYRRSERNGEIRYRC